MSSLNPIGARPSRPMEWVVCPICGATRWASPPHGEGTPCPIAQAKFQREQERVEVVQEALLEKMKAETASAERAQFSMLDASQMLKRVQESFGLRDDDEEDAGE